MKTPKKSHELIWQNEQVEKKSQKHDANLKKNSILFFQIGLIVCLLAAFGLLEMKFQKTDDLVTVNPPIDDDLNVFNDLVRVYEEQLKKELVKNTPNSFKEPIISYDGTIEEIPEIFTEPLITIDPINPGDINVDEVPEDLPISVDFIEQVPIYPGCQRKKAMMLNVNVCPKKSLN